MPERVKYTGKRIGRVMPPGRRNNLEQPRLSCGSTMWLVGRRRRCVSGSGLAWPPLMDGINVFMTDTARDDEVFGSHSILMHNGARGTPNGHPRAGGGCPGLWVRIEHTRPACQAHRSPLLSGSRLRSGCFPRRWRAGCRLSAKAPNNVSAAGGSFSSVSDAETMIPGAFGRGWPAYAR